MPRIHIPIVPFKKLKAHRHWEKLMETTRLSDNGKIRMEGFVIGAVTVLIASFIAIGL